MTILFHFLQHSKLVAGAYWKQNDLSSAILKLEYFSRRFLDMQVRLLQLLIHQMVVHLQVQVMIISFACGNSGTGQYTWTLAGRLGDPLLYRPFHLKEMPSRVQVMMGRFRCGIFLLLHRLRHKNPLIIKLQMYLNGICLRGLDHVLETVP